MKQNLYPKKDAEGCCCGHCGSCGGFTVAEAFYDHMVLQREEPVRIWGEGSYEGQTIIAAIGKAKASCRVNEKLEWLLELSPMEASCEPRKLILSDGGQNTVFEDVLIGDVWVISGQSNADLVFVGNAQVRALYDDFLNEADAGKNIRLLEQWRSESIDTPEKMAAPQKGFTNRERSKWKRADSAKAVETFSIFGYSFAEHVAQQLEYKIPIGMIMAASGGSPMMELMPMELVKAMGYDKPEKENIPLAGMYNALMAPVQNMTIKGMIFYQGESEQGRNQVYPYQLNWYVEELRRRFLKDFPFYYVQISSHGDVAIQGWPKIEEVRYRQLEAMELIKNAHMAVSMDVGWREGDCDWAHPHYKRPVGQRVARLALAQQYGIGDLEHASSPMPINFYWGKDHVKITFAYAGEGLAILAGDCLVGFEIKAEGGEYVQAQAEIAGKNTVVVIGIQKPAAVRYAHMHLAYIENANLGNSEKLPAPAFEKVK